MVKEISVLDCKVSDRRQIKEKTLSLDISKMKGVSQPLHKILEASFEYRN